MAVTIDDMHVEVADGVSAPAPAAAPGVKPKSDLHAALELLHERERRLRAD